MGQSAAGYFQPAVSTPQASSNAGVRQYNPFEQAHLSPTSAYGGAEVQSTPWHAKPGDAPL